MEDTNKLPQTNSNESTSSNTPLSQTPATQPNQTPQPDSSDPVPTTPLPANTDANAPQTPSEPLRKSRLIILLIIILFLAGLGFAAWYFQNQIQKTASEAVTKKPQVAEAVKKDLIVGTDPTFKPMEYMENNEMIGYDIDLANFLSQELKQNVEIRSIEFDNLFTSLENSEIDMVISGVTITEERQQKYTFSNEYLNAGQVIITQKDNETIRSTADLSGKKIAVQKGTTNEEEALKYTEDTLVLSYEDFELATKSLVEGQADAIFTDLPNAKGIIVANPTLKIASDPFTNEFYGIVFRKDDTTVKEVNAALNSLRVKGILTDLKQKWLD